jgi:hypothetical protein
MQILNPARYAAMAGSLLFLLQPLGLTGMARAQMVVPGTGMRADKVGDDFEDAKWAYIFQNPKSSHEQDEQVRTPAGQSTNARWSESAKRGHPDVIERVPTPPEGLPGSQGALLIKTLHSGVPGSISGQNQQDDLICNVRGGPYSVSSGPSVVVRVALPPFDQWEQRQGNSFGVRLSVEGYRPNDGKRDTYWPGMFIYYYPPATVRGKDGKPQQREAYAQMVVRAGPVGQDMWGPKMTEPGWWTLGMSCSGDGMIHYFAHAGVENLTHADLITSQSPYGFQAERLQSFFFDVVNRDDGENWSTPWIIDDPALYFAQRPIHSPNMGTSGGKDDKGGGMGLFGRRRR